MASFNEMVLDSLRQAGLLVSGDREETHGSIPENYERIARLWSSHLGKEVSPADVCIMQALLKIGRMQGGCYNADDFLDAQSYLAMAHALCETRA